MTTTKGAPGSEGRLRPFRRGRRRNTDVAIFGPF